MANNTSNEGRTSVLIEERRRQILDATIRSLAYGGYDSVRFRDIAEEAQVSIGLIQHYFINREQLLESAFDRACRTIIDEVPPGPFDGGPYQMLLALMARVTDPFKALVWTEFAVASARHESLKPPFEAVYAQWRTAMTSIIERGQRDGIFRPLFSIPEIVDLLVAYLDGSLLALASDSNVATAEGIRQRLERLTNLVLDYDEMAVAIDSS